MTKNGQLTDIADELADAARQGNDTVRVGQLIDALDARGYGPALAVLPLVGISPIAGIPGFPTALALILAILTVRLLLGHDHFWAPDWLRRRTLDADKVQNSIGWLKPLSQRIDATLHDRLAWMAGQGARKAACVVILALLLAVPPLELLPFAAAGPMLVVAVFGLALLYRDGLLMVLGFLGAALVGGMGLWAAFGG
ncbi:exopolysaccharide biosynthesis protein [Paracoccus sp. 1_MG-2023]|uniref:exopolysaccharide biosynthesis protein n=1 Tax=unclassified Paracoccus (in: a-proteobacteria) TaxID=2688777 RepID=UPI001C082AA9|nr:MULTISPECIES: exopolysaccharide biosynthesis protein [unclassified Paracoccus (in: a-proteobacteria)]MBU2957906.1 exopolysaccharide biosynthesis protein [Paracoccus sp. C2R09]MDO6668901.1 exopolysaccharide biosynthesis protein [Paracoccus sp. 1_MG-2023]